MHLLLFSENSKLEGDWQNKILTTQMLGTNFEHFEPDCNDLILDSNHKVTFYDLSNYSLFLIT